MSVLATLPLGFAWPAFDPFLFCVHHDDHYPAGNDQLGPAASLAGRDLGQDFSGTDAPPGTKTWRMYHGLVVPGFPSHPHRGFETVTVARRGLIDHSDSLGAAARFGRGDVQWMTAGKGIVHSEMFPLLERAGENPMELFQIWINLPASDKMVDPHFAMLWNEQIPTVELPGARVTVIAGSFGSAVPPRPPPRSWAARPDTEVSILAIRLDPGAALDLPAASPGVNRTLYFFDGVSLSVGGQVVGARTGVRVRPEVPLTLVNGPAAGEVLVLQGRPIREPVVQHGPFVMNSAEEIQAAYADYRRTRFGGWPWRRDDPVHPREDGRFARHADGRVERPRV